MTSPQPLPQRGRGLNQLIPLPLLPWEKGWKNKIIKILSPSLPGRGK